MQHVLITGGAGFIGSHLADRLLHTGRQVTVVDNFDRFYDPALKRRNLAACGAGVSVVEADIRDLGILRRTLTGRYDVIVHLAAKAGVRPSISDPGAYQSVNVCGTQNLLELARERSVKQFVFASSSSVYGINGKVPWREDDSVLRPVSLYASSKVSGELLGHVYSHLYGMRFLALRFFTVYGPRQRPDLAIHKFAHLLCRREALPVYGDGTSRRDYTYIDDIVDGICAATDYSGSSYEVINLGNNHPIGVLELIHMLEEVSGLHAELKRLPMQDGDVPLTFADIRKARDLLEYQPRVGLEEGLRRFWLWLTEDTPHSAEAGLEPARCFSSVGL